MLDIKQTEVFYPEFLKSFKRNVLREYLQYKILEMIFDSKFGRTLSFMGGTAIHMTYANKKFSEDLNFDNSGLTKRGLEELVKLIKRGLELERVYNRN